MGNPVINGVKKRKRAIASVPPAASTATREVPDEGVCGCCLGTVAECGPLAVHYSVMSCIGIAREALAERTVYGPILRDARRYKVCIDAGMDPVLVLDRREKIDRLRRDRAVAAGSLPRERSSQRHKSRLGSPMVAHGSVAQPIHEAPCVGSTALPIQVEHASVNNPGVVGSPTHPMSTIGLAASVPRPKPCVLELGNRPRGGFGAGGHAHSHPGVHPGMRRVGGSGGGGAAAAAAHAHVAPGHGQEGAHNHFGNNMSPALRTLATLSVMRVTNQGRPSPVKPQPVASPPSHITLAPNGVPVAGVGGGAMPPPASSGVVATDGAAPVAATSAAPHAAATATATATTLAPTTAAPTPGVPAATATSTATSTSTSTAPAAPAAPASPAAMASNNHSNAPTHMAVASNGMPLAAPVDSAAAPASGVHYAPNGVPLAPSYLAAATHAHSGASRMPNPHGGRFPHFYGGASAAAAAADGTMRAAAAAPSYPSAARRAVTTGENSGQVFASPGQPRSSKRQCFRQDTKGFVSTAQAPSSAGRMAVVTAGHPVGVRGPMDDVRDMVRGIHDVLGGLASEVRANTHRGGELLQHTSRQLSDTNQQVAGLLSVINADKQRILQLEQTVSGLKQSVQSVLSAVGVLVERIQQDQAKSS